MLCSHSVNHQGQVFSGPPHPVCLIQTSDLTSYCPIHTRTHAPTHTPPYLTLQQAHSLSWQTMTTRTRRHPTNSPRKKEAPSVDKHHLGDRLLKDTTENYLWQIQKEKGWMSLLSDSQLQADTEQIFDQQLFISVYRQYRLFPCWYCLWIFSMQYNMILTRCSNE